MVVLALSLIDVESSFIEKLIPVLPISNCAGLLLIIGATSIRLILISSTSCPNLVRTLRTNFLPPLVV